MITKTNNNKENLISPTKHSGLLSEKHISSSGSRIKVLFVLLDNFSMVSFTGAVDVLLTSNLLTPGPIFEIITGSINGSKVNSDLGIEVSVNSTVDKFNIEDIDILIICGGLRTPLRNIPSIQSISKKAIKKNKWIGGLWNGAYFLAGSGVFDHHECAVHPDSRELMKEHYPNAKISRASYVIDGRYFSCVGPNGAIRVMLDLLEELFDSDIKRGVNGILLADTNRSINSAFSKGVKFLPHKLETIIELMESNLEEPLEISDFSEYTSLSRRQVERLFSKYLNKTPSRYYLELRLHKGRQLLLKTNYSISEVAVACGFISPTHFSHSFKMMYGSSPTSVRLEGKDLF